MTPPAGKPILDLRIPPQGRSAAEGYKELLELLDSFRKELDSRSVTNPALREWERAVTGFLHDREIDRFMRVMDEDDAAPLAEQRWRNLRAILLARKGLPPQYC